MLHQHDVHQNHTYLSENEVQHDIFSGYVTTNSDAEGFLADNLSDLPDPLLTSTVKKRNFHEANAVVVTL